MSESAKIIEGPSQSDVLKSLTTFASNKKVLDFSLEGGQKFTARAYGVRDTGTFDTDAKSGVYIVTLDYHAPLGPERGKAEATFFIDTEKWGRWAIIPDF